MTKKSNALPFIHAKQHPHLIYCLGKMRSIALALSCLAFSITAQNQSPVSESPTSTVASPYLLFRQTLGENAPLYNGSEYVNHGQNILGHAFFGSPDLETASIEYDGALYPDVPLGYDLVSDEVVVKDFTGNYYIRLVSEKISSFTLLHHRFIYLPGDSAGGPPKGFYDHVYDGESTVLVKRHKQIRYSTSVEKTTSEFVQYNTYYLEVNGYFYKITNRAGFFAAFSKKRSEIRKFYRDQHLQFRKDPEGTMVNMAKHYDTLKN